MEHQTVNVEDKYPVVKCIPLSIQHLLGMFGSSMLVPLLFKIDPAVVLLFDGVGTIVYILVVKFKVPAVMGSSFSYIAPVVLISSIYGYESACGAFVVCGLLLMIIGAVITKIGIAWLNKLLPPAAVGVIITVIGLQLLPQIVKDLGFLNPVVDHKTIIVFLLTLSICLFGLMIFRGFLLTMVIFISIVIGYVFAFFVGIVDLTEVVKAPWVALPTFYTPKLNISAILIMAPVVLVLTAENLGHLIVTGNVIGRDLMKNPGFGRSLLGNGLSTFIRGIFGSVPDTTYAENIGIMAVTKIFSIRVFIGVACLAILLSFVRKIALLIQSIPYAVMNGVCFFLFGIIAASGLQLLIETKVDYSKPRNQAMTLIVLVSGTSGMQLHFGHVVISGMCLSAITAIFFSLIFILLDKFKLTSDTGTK